MSWYKVPSPYVRHSENLKITLPCIFDRLWSWQIPLVEASTRCGRVAAAAAADLWTAGWLLVPLHLNCSNTVVNYVVVTIHKWIFFFLLFSIPYVAGCLSCYIRNRWNLIKHSVPNFRPIFKTLCVDWRISTQRFVILKGRKILKITTSLVFTIFIFLNKTFKLDLSRIFYIINNVFFNDDVFNTYLQYFMV